jgi:hypothetical protein
MPPEEVRLAKAPQVVVHQDLVDSADLARMVPVHMDLVHTDLVHTVLVVGSVAGRLALLQSIK